MISTHTHSVHLPVLFQGRRNTIPPQKNGSKIDAFLKTYDENTKNPETLSRKAQRQERKRIQKLQDSEVKAEKPESTTKGARTVFTDSPFIKAKESRAQSPNPSEASYDRLSDAFSSRHSDISSRASSPNRRNNDPEHWEKISTRLPIIAKEKNAASTAMAKTPSESSLRSDDWDNLSVNEKN